jgi:hypothetical protein
MRIEGLVTRETEARDGRKLGMVGIAMGAVLIALGIAFTHYYSCSHQLPGKLAMKQPSPTGIAVFATVAVVGGGLMGVSLQKMRSQQAQSKRDRELLVQMAVLLAGLAALGVLAAYLVSLNRWFSASTKTVGATVGATGGSLCAGLAGAAGMAAWKARKTDVMEQEMQEFNREVL